MELLLQSSRRSRRRRLSTLSFALELCEQRCGFCPVRKPVGLQRGLGLMSHSCGLVKCRVVHPLGLLELAHRRVARPVEPEGHQDAPSCTGFGALPCRLQQLLRGVQMHL